MIAPLLFAQVFACGESSSASTSVVATSSNTTKVCPMSGKSGDAKACHGNTNTSADNNGTPAVLASLQTAGPTCGKECNMGSVALASVISIGAVLGSVMMFKKVKI